MPAPGRSILVGLEHARPPRPPNETRARSRSRNEERETRGRLSLINVERSQPSPVSSSRRRRARARERGANKYNWNNNAAVPRRSCRAFRALAPDNRQKNNQSSSTFRNFLSLRPVPVPSPSAPAFAPRSSVFTSSLSRSLVRSSYPASFLIWSISK